MGTNYGKEKPEEIEKPYPEYSSPGKLFEHQQIEDTKATSKLYGASNDAINFFRLACLILDVCSDAMRDLLRCKISNNEDILTNTIAKHRQNFKTLHDGQKKILFPSNGLVEYRSLDFTMMYSVARNVCPDKIEPNKSKWGKTPAPGDKSLLAAIETIRRCRNIFFAHATEAKLHDSKFEELWTDLEFAVNKIYESLGQFAVSATYKGDIINLKTMTMDQKSKKLLLQLTEMARKWNDLNEMEVQTDLILEDLMDMRKNFEKKRSENKEPGTPDDNNFGQTKSYLENSRKENNSFTETQIYRKVEQLLEGYKCVILVGKEGTGKTSMAVRLMFNYNQRDDFTVRKLHRPSHFCKYVNTQKCHLVVIENVFECSEHELSKLKNSFDNIQHFIPLNADATKSDAFKVHIVMTSRPHTYKVTVNKLKINPFLLNNCMIDLDSNDWKLHKDDMEKIMREKMEAAFDLQGYEKDEFSPIQWSHIVESSSPFGFPLCAHLFAFDLKYRKFGVDFFSNPHAYMLSRVEDLIKEDKTKKTEVLFLLILINHIQNKLLKITENKKCWEILSDLQLTTELELNATHVDNLYALAKDIDRLEVFVRESPRHVFHFIHHSVQEAVQNYFVETYTIKAIEILPLHVLFPKMQRDYVLNSGPKLKSEFFRRLREEIRNGNLCEVCQYEELKDNQVSKEFIEDMMKDEKDFIDILHTKDKNDIPLMYQLTLVVCEGTIQYILGHTTFKRICSDLELYNQYFYSLLACCKLQGNRTLTEYILMAYSGEDIQNQFLKTNNTNASSKSEEVTYLSPLHVALKHQNKSAMQLLLKHKATFTPVRWQAWPFLHKCCEYGVSQFCCPELLESVYEFENEKTLNPENELKRDLDYSKIKSVENEDLKDFVLKLHNLFKDPESPDMILLNLVEIPYLDITGKLILSFCSMQAVKERAEEMNKHPMNFANADGNTVLHLYLKLYDDNEGLLEESEGEDIDLENESDCRLLAVEVCNNDSLELIKQRKVVNRSKHLSTIEVLCTSGIDLNMKNKSEQTPLMIEISKSRPSIEAISILLKYGADPNEDQFSQTCLNKIIKQNYKNYKISETIELLFLLIGHKAAVDKKDQNGDNLIFIELKRQNPRIKILRFLININIDMSVKDTLGRNALCLALQLPNDVLQKERVVRALLISKKLNVLSRDKDGRSALGLAILDVKYHEKILKQIVDHETCAYPLHECIKENFAENIKIQALKYLMSTDPRKSNIHAVNDKLETVLITAAKSCPDMDTLFQFLMTNDIDINARDIYKNTALYYVIEASNIDLTKRSATIYLLLSKHPFVHDEDGIKDLHSPLLTALKFLIDRSYIVLTESVMHADEKSIQNSDLESPTPILQNKDVSLNLKIVQKILDIAETDLKAYEADENKRTYLHYCASSRFSDDKTLPICRRLVELGVDVDKKDKDGLTCVDMAFKYSDKNNHTLMYLMSSCNLESFDIDETLQYLADNNSLNVEILKYMKENILSRKKTRNILHYLASIGYEPKSYSKSQCDELFDVLQSCFAVDEENVDSKIPLHIAIEENSRSSCVLNFLRITKSFINKPDDDGNTALHLVLKSEREDSDVLTIVKQMIHFKVNVNSKNEMQQTPLMVAVTCLKERTSTIKAILKEKPDLNLRDREGSTILHHCIEAKKDDFTACSILSLFLDSGLRVPLNSKSWAGLTPLNLAATNVSYSRVLCILKLVHNKDNMAVTVDRKGQSPLYNAADSLSGVHPLIVLERLIRSYIFLRQEDKPYLKTDKGYTVLEVCEKSKYRSLTDLLETKKTCEETIYYIIQKALIDVSGRLFEKSLDKFDDDFLRDNPLIPKKIKTLIANSIPYLSKCRLEHLTDEVPEEDYENESSVPDLENVNNTK